VPDSKSGPLPKFIDVKPIRNVGQLPSVIADVESHLPAGHVYGDPDRVTMVHEGTHGINSLLRQRYGQPVFYILHNRAVRLNEPRTTLAAIAKQIPASLRGAVYRLYLIQMQSYWNDTPTYIFDEWTAYTNGAEARQELGIHDRSETARYALEFCVYSAYVPQDKQTKAFYKWQAERTMQLYRLAGIQDTYLHTLQQSQDATGLRAKLRDTYGPHWTQEVFGIRAP
jgi:hypothetical protein